MHNLFPQSRIFRIFRLKYLLMLSVAGCLLLEYTLLEPHWLQTRELVIENREIPAGFDGVRILFLADIHHGPAFSIDRVDSLVKRVNALEPDIILLGGDYVNRGRQFIKPLYKSLSGLKASIFKGAVLGNHDHWESASLSRQEMEKAGITLLDNQAIWLERNGDRIRIGGVGDLWEGRQNPEVTVEGTEKRDFVILLSHNPDYFAKISGERIDLMLSGHTHGGQVTFFGLWAPIVPIENSEYSSGLFRKGDATLYVTTGVGTIIPPVRFFCPPEIVNITLRSVKRESDSPAPVLEKSL